MTDDSLANLMPPDDYFREILAEVAKTNPTKLPKTYLEIQIARIIAQGFEKLMKKIDDQ